MITILTALTAGAVSARVKLVGPIVRLDVEPENAEVLVDGRSLGTAAENRELRLEPGPHTIEFRYLGLEPKVREVRVLSREEWATATVDGEPVRIPKRWTKYEDYKRKIGCEFDDEEIEEARGGISEEVWMERVHAATSPVNGDGVFTLDVSADFDEVWRAVSLALFDLAESPMVMDPRSGTIETTPKVLLAKIGIGGAKGASHTFSIRVLPADTGVRILLRRNVLAGGGFLSFSGGAVASDGYFEEKLIERIRAHLNG
jgi:hypothetical protein